MGAVILPPMLTYYDHPQSIEACTARMADRILSQFGLDERAYEWEGM
jgi:3-polyprenyl-4-hydroxybenzoate decarboxylase